MGRQGPAMYEVVLWEPETSDPERLRTGASYAGDSWKECFRRLREDQEKHGWTSARLVPKDSG